MKQDGYARQVGNPRTRTCTLCGTTRTNAYPLILCPNCDRGPLAILEANRA